MHLFYLHLRSLGRMYVGPTVVTQVVIQVKIPAVNAALAHVPAPLSQAQAVRALLALKANPARQAYAIQANVVVLENLVFLV